MSEDKELKSVQKSKIAEREEVILKYWQDNKIFEKTIALRQAEGKEFIFYDGPPFATGLPHYGHILAGTIKDVIPRYKTMNGFHVPRRWGWDCHGLPVENIVEKELGFKTKKDIENYGIANFNKKARESVMQFADDWRKIVPRLGRFVDMDNDYRTMDSSYTESVWWAFKKLYDGGLIYEGFKSMHICPHCETTLSNFEVTQGYKDVTDISVYVKFKLITDNKQLTTKESPNTYLVVWTTTPWTLPGNVALAVNPDIDYVKIKFSPSLKSLVFTSVTNMDGAETKKTIVTEGSYIFSKEIFWKSINSNTPLSEPIRIIFDFDKNDLINFASNKEGFFLKYNDKIDVIKGKNLLGGSYEPIFNYYQGSTLESGKGKTLKNRENGWKVYAGDFVTTEDGTGIVHIAPAFGEDDYRLSLKEKLPFVQHVGMDGRFKPEIKDFSGLSVKPKDDPQRTDIEILKNLAGRGLLFGKEKITHPYPHCWRCDTPLLNYATSSWFVKVTAIKDKLVALNKKVNWIPPSIGQYRFGNWLSEARDWAISRSRFWGAPIPVWRCLKCGELKIAGSLSDISQSPKNKFIVMRHGEADNNVLRVTSSRVENQHHLTKRGIKQVEKSVDELKKEKIDYIFHSPLVRTTETANIVAKKLNIKTEAIIADSRLREVGHGAWEGKSVDEYRKAIGNDWHFDRFSQTKDGVESFNSIMERMTDFLIDIDSKYSGKNILIVSHDSPIWLMLSRAEGFDPKEAIKKRGDGDVSIKNAEIRKVSFKIIPRNESHSLDFHRPYIDLIKFDCKCGGEMKRVPEVFDCWFESGSMPYASNHYPFDKTKGKPFDPVGGIFHAKKGFPADFIAEGVDQTRGWFYSMIVLGVSLFGKVPFNNVVVNGTILAEDGEKMSKRLKNYPDPIFLVDRYGADALRYYLISSPSVKAEDVNFSEKGVDEVSKKIINRLDNVLSFYLLYAPLLPATSYQLLASSNVLDIWIKARLGEVVEDVSKSMENYELDKATRPIGDFIEDLSVWYLRRSRERVKGDDDTDRHYMLATLKFVLQEFSKILAPFTPFLAEHIFQSLLPATSYQLQADSSVHLETWPVKLVDYIRRDELAKMAEVRNLVSKALELRAKANIKVRQPLATLRIKNQESRIKNDEEFIQLIKDEVNVKHVVFKEKMEDEISLDTTLTSELKEEGAVRELIRGIQDLRKRAGLTIKDVGDLSIETDELGKKFIEKNKNSITKATLLRSISFASNILSEPIDAGEGLVFKIAILK